jgi:hypothetical protein
VTGALLAVAVVGLGSQIKSKGYGPFVMGLVSLATILPGKFLIGSNLMTHGGVALLMIASAWSLVPRRSAPLPLARCARPLVKAVINRFEEGTM